MNVFSCKGEYVSPIFVKPKTDRSYRLILNLKKLDEEIPFVHFEMETLQSNGNA